MSSTDSSPTRFSILFDAFPPSALRLGMFVIAMFVGYQLIYRAILRYGVEPMTTESGPVEIAQAVFCLLAFICLLYAAIVSRLGRSMVLLSAALLGYATARESDHAMEELLFAEAHHWLVGLPMAMAALMVVVHYRWQLFADLRFVMEQPSAVLFIVAGACLCCLGQTFDRPGLWATPQLQSDTSWVTNKVLAEELCELFAYSLLVFASFEAALLARRTSRCALARASRGGAKWESQATEVESCQRAAA